MKGYEMENESYVTLKDGETINARNVYMLTVDEGSASYVNYCKISGAINNGELDIICSHIGSLLGKGKIFSYHSDINSVSASYARISSSHVRGIASDCEIVGNLSEIYYSKLDNPKSIFGNCVFGSCEINAGTFKHCVFLNDCKISKDAVIE